MPEIANPGAPRVIMAFDFGTRRIGVACGDTVSRTARAIATLPSTGGAQAWPAIASLMRDWQPAAAIVGLPYNADDTEGPLARAARGFAAGLAERFRIPVALVDERYSSLEAEASLKYARETGLRRRRVAKGDVDAAAARVILERWFETSRETQCSHN